MAVDAATRSVQEAEPHASVPLATEPTRRIYRNLGALGGGQAVTWLVTLAWTFVVPRILGPAGIGVIVTATSVAGIFSILLGLGTRNYLVREIVVAPDDGPRLIGTALVLRFVMIPFFCAATVAYTLVSHTPHDQAIVIYLASAAALILLICEPYQAGFQATERMQYLAYGDVINKTGQSIIGILLAVAGFRAIGITASWVVIAVVVLVATHVWWARMSRVTLRTTAGELRAMLRGSAAYWAFGVFFLIYLWIDTVMLSLLTNPQTVGYYGVPTRLFQTMMFLPVLISMAWLPRLVQAYEEHPRHLRTAARQPVELVLILGLPIGAATIIFAGPVIRLLYGPAYGPAIGVMMLLGLCIPPIFLNILLNQVLIAAKRQSTWTWAMLGATIVNPLFNLALIPYTQRHYHNGALGAAMSLVLTEVLIVALGLVLVGHHVITPGGVRRVAASTVASVAMVAGGLGMRSYGPAISIACGIAAFVVVGALVGLVTPRKLREARQGFAALRGAPGADAADALLSQVPETVPSDAQIPGDPIWTLDGVAGSVEPVHREPAWAADEAAATAAPIAEEHGVQVDATTTPASAGAPRPAGILGIASVPPIIPLAGGVRDEAAAPAGAATDPEPVRRQAPDGPRGAEADPVRAIELYRHADDAFRSAGERLPTAFVLENAAFEQCRLADRARAAGHRADAELAFGRALALAGEAAVLPAAGDRAVHASAEAIAGRALIGLGQPQAALEHLKARGARRTGEQRPPRRGRLSDRHGPGPRGRRACAGRPERGAARGAPAGGVRGLSDPRPGARGRRLPERVHRRPGDGPRRGAQVPRPQPWPRRRAPRRRDGSPRPAGCRPARVGADRAPRKRIDHRPGHRRTRPAMVRRAARRAHGPRAGPGGPRPDRCGVRMSDDAAVSSGLQDEILGACGRVLTDVCRDRDVIARFGAEEFAIALPGVDLEGALGVCRRMRHAIADYPWGTLAPQLGVTATVGCVIGRPGMTTSDMLARADLQLCAAKDAT